ncbi:hypothetical protein [Aeromicrobium sp.]|uniref:hypothetical protein n=1 Tax=Aeromicrobium sp. TaxID=1871063 RepID=UPI0019CD3BB6|nr:hypothetical protein [Aeromicrobium sp.]MBC7632276.1 hypothetical protein [Aeromicrobium sp.]
MNKALGYGLSMLILAAASLLAIPAMIRADGQQAWGAIAIGQTVGAVGAVLVAYGWMMSGPARVARGDASSRRRDYAESVIVRISLFVPVTVVAASVAAAVTPGHRLLAAAGALSGSAIGLTANWYFVGVGRPYAFLVFETIPRVVGTVVGIALMRSGSDALVGVLAQSAGMLVAFGVVMAWVSATTARAGATPLRRRPATEILSAQRHGVVASLGSAVYVAAPMIIVSAVAPSVQPLYALADKVQRQISIALGPLVTVFQGWVPRAAGSALHQRARVSLWIAGAGSLVLSLAMLLPTPVLLDWLGDGQIDVPLTVVIIMSLFVGCNLFESLISKAVLASLDRLGSVARATLVSALVGLPLVAVGAIAAGAAGALVAVVAGLALRMVIELFVAVRAIRPEQTVGSIAMPASSSDKGKHA